MLGDTTCALGTNSHDTAGSYRSYGEAWVCHGATSDSTLRARLSPLRPFCPLSMFIRPPFGPEGQLELVKFL